MGWPGLSGLCILGSRYNHGVRSWGLRGQWVKFLNSTIFTQIVHFWHTYSSYNNFTCCKVSLISLTYFLSYEFLFLEIRTYIQNLSPRTNFKYMIQDFFHSILDASRKRLTIDISEIFLEKKEKNFFLSKLNLRNFQVSTKLIWSLFLICKVGEI